MFNAIKHPKKRAFLAAYGECGIVKAAAKVAGISRELHYDWLRHDNAYALAFRVDATELAGDALEDEARRRAHLGVREVVLYQGEPVMIDGKPLMKRKYSDALMLAFLKAKRNGFADKKEISGANGAPIEIVVKFV